jgi:hypothetical protein
VAVVDQQLDLADIQGSPQITTAEECDAKPQHRLNIGLTWTGLQALGAAGRGAR